MRWSLEGSLQISQRLLVDFFRPLARLGRGAISASSITPGQASESSLRYFPAFQFEMNFAPETPSTRWACASTMVVTSRRVIHFTPEVTGRLAVTVKMLLPHRKPCWLESMNESSSCVNSKLRCVVISYVPNVTIL